MDETPRTFTAPESGWYHAVTGQEPHLIASCTDECYASAMNSGAPVEVPMDTVTVPWDHA